MVRAISIRFACVFAAVSGCLAAEDVASSDARSCRKIDPQQYESYLFFNPRGHQTYFWRSRCLQEAAVENRTPALCDEVRERKALLLDGSGISPESCRALAAAGHAQDLAEANRLAAAPFQRLTALTISRNGNGRDLDATVQTSGGHGGVYSIEIRATRQGAARTLLRQRLSTDATPQTRRYFLTNDQLARTLGSDWEAEAVTFSSKLHFDPDGDERRVAALLEPAIMESAAQTSIRASTLAPWRPDSK